MNFDLHGLRTRISISVVIFHVENSHLDVIQLSFVFLLYSVLYESVLGSVFIYGCIVAAPEPAFFILESVGTVDVETRPALLELPILVLCNFQR